MSDKILFIMGNGPSLKEIMDNPDYLKILKDNHTFGLNSAYRAYEKYNFYPTYFGCFDYIHNEEHKDSFEKLVLEYNDIKEFYFIGSRTKGQGVYKEDVLNNERFIKFNFINTDVHKYSGISKSFEEFYNSGNSGSNALQVGIMKGYKKIVLVGCDCNYIEKLSNVRHCHGKLELTTDLDVNPNYWFSGYQRKGDRFNMANVPKYHIGGWNNLIKFKPSDVDIINCSMISKIPFFDKLPFTRLNERM